MHFVPVPMRTVHVRVTGRVQGVGYRAWTDRKAMEFGLNGWVRNRTDGSVEAVFQGPEPSIDKMLEACRQGPSAASVADVEVSVEEAGAIPSFEVRATA